MLELTTGEAIMSPVSYLKDNIGWIIIIEHSLILRLLSIRFPLRYLGVLVNKVLNFVSEGDLYRSEDL